MISFKLISKYYIFKLGYIKKTYMLFIQLMYSNVTNRYLSLPPKDNKLQALYIWLGGSGELRSKTKTIFHDGKTITQLPIWNYDGSSTGQATGSNSEVFLKPVCVYKDPFRRGNNILVWCESVFPDTKEPIPTNTRHACNELMNKVADQEPWFGLEQEYTLFQADGKTLLGWSNGTPVKQGQYYCSVGTNNAIGRDVVEAHYKCCLYAGLKIAGSNAEVMPGQWEYQIGPCHGIEAGDQVWVSRYILQRVCEDFGVIASFDPKPLKGWNGAGCHTNYSTKEMREVGGYEEILTAIRKLENKHADHINVYGENKNRLTGKHETSSYTDFSYGVADRGASVRIPYQTKIDGYGYFEDRRPASNCDPYLVTGKLVETTLL